MTDEPYAVNVIESDSLWERIKTIGSRPIFIAAAVIGLLLLAIVTTIIVVLTRDKSDPGNLAIDYSKALIVSDDHYLWALDLNSQEKKLLVRTIWGISAFDIYRKNTIYWHEYRSSYVNSLSEKYHNLTQTRKWEPVSIAMDWVTEKVYVLDYLAGKLNVYDTMSTSYGIAVADLKNPVDLALDPIRGLMFIVQKSDSILKGNMDGTSIEKIITSSSVTAIALDTQTPKLYFSDADKIESSDYFGNQRQTVTRLSSSTTTLGVSGNRLFWTKVTRSLGTRSLWSCTLTNNNCDEKDLQQISFDDPVTIKVYTGSGPIVANPCENDNGGCDQLCLLKANNERSCGCYIGYKLQDDGKNCELVNEYILYTRGNLVRGRILDPKKEAFTDAIAPFLIEKTILDDKKTIDFDYNYYTNTLAYSDDNNVGTTNLLKEDEGTYSRDKCLKSVSYDWVTNDIYYIKDNCNTTDNTTIVVMKPNQESYFWKTMHTFQATIGHPKALVVHPNRGGYYFTIKRKGSAQIYKGHGLKTRPFLEQLDVNETALAIDYVEDRLYWFSQDMTKLYNADLKGTDIKSIDISIIKDPTSISAHQRYAYVSNLTNIWRFDTFNGSGRIKLIPRLNDDSESLISGVKIYSPMVQSVDTNNLCAIENGQCEQFCFREPKKVVTGPNAVDVTDELHKVCVCEDFKSIRADGRTCS